MHWVGIDRWSSLDHPPIRKKNKNKNKKKRGLAWWPEPAFGSQGWLAYMALWVPVAWPVHLGLWAVTLASLSGSCLSWKASSSLPSLSHDTVLPVCASFILPGMAVHWWFWFICNAAMLILSCIFLITVLLLADCSEMYMLDILCSLSCICMCDFTHFCNILVD